MKKTTLFAMLSFLCIAVFSQSSKVNNNWYFDAGNVSAGVTFNNTSVTPTNVSGSQATGLFASASVSDENGNLLFYTNGRTLWNASGGVVINPSTNSPIDEVLIVPNLNNPDQYYVFYAENGPPGNTSGGYGYDYWIINAPNGSNVSLAGGGFLLDENGFQFNSFSTSAKRIASHYDSASNTVWVMVLSVNKILTYKMDSTGFVNIPFKISSNITFDSVPISIGNMKVSPDGTKMALSLRTNTLTTNNDALMMDFDASTGEVSSPIQIPLTYVYDIEFSPNSQILYLRSNTLQANRGSQISKNFGSLPNAIFSMPTNKSVLGRSFNPTLVPSNIYGVGDLQLHPNGKIYFNNFVFGTFSSYLGVIENPDEPISTNVTLNEQLLLLSSSANISYSSLPRKVIDLDEGCDGFPKEFANSYTGVLSTDSENSVIYGGEVQSSAGVTIDGVTYQFPYYTAKYDQNGCLVFVRQETNRIVDIKTDEQNDIYLMKFIGAAEYGIQKITDDGLNAWTYNTPSNFEMRDFDYSNNEILIIGKNRSGWNTEIHRINRNSGALISVTIIQDSSAHGDYGRIVTNKDTNEFYIGLNIVSGSITYGSTIITSQNPGYMDIVLLKYDIFFNSVIPANSYFYVNTWTGGVIYADSDIYYNRSTNHIFFTMYDQLRIFDQNLNLLSNVNYPFSSPGYNPETNFSEATNTFTMLRNNQLYKIEDIPPYSLTTVAIDQGILNIQTADYTLSSWEEGKLHTMTSDNKIYLTGASTAVSNNRILSKMDATTGDLLNKSLVNKEILIEEIAIERTITAYPNPFNESISIKALDEDVISQVVIYNQQGNVLLTYKADKNQNSLSLKTSQLSRGLYLMKVIFEDGSSSIKRIIKD